VSEAIERLQPNEPEPEPRPRRDGLRH
jgi:hypothetical protein